VTTVIPDDQSCSYDLFNLTDGEALRYGGENVGDQSGMGRSRKHGHVLDTPRT
jgi:hypothetical protein